MNVIDDEKESKALVSQHNNFMIFLLSQGLCWRTDNIGTTRAVLSKMFIMISYHHISSFLTSSLIWNPWHSYCIVFTILEMLKKKTQMGKTIPFQCLTFTQKPQSIEILNGRHISWFHKAHVTRYLLLCKRWLLFHIGLSSFGLDKSLLSSNFSWFVQLL